MSSTSQTQGMTYFVGIGIKKSDGAFQDVINSTGAIVGVNSHTVQTTENTVATTGATNAYAIAPIAGVLTSVDFSCIDALAQHGSNYVTFTLVNLGQAGAGSTAMLAVTDANTTKTTTGTAIVANGKFSLTLHGTAANLVVAAGDRLKLVVTATGTLANTLTGSIACLRFSGA